MATDIRVVESPPKKTVVVAGMGPGGLVAAIEAIKKGYHVVVFDPRGDHFRREQRVKLDVNSLQYLRNIIDPSSTVEVNFYNQIVNVEHQLPIDVLQEFLFKKLQQLLAMPGMSGELRIGPDHDIKEFDLSDKEKNRVKVKSHGKEEVLEFTYFVAADGAKHKMSDKLNEALEKIGEKDKKIIHKDLETQTRQAPHGTVCLRAKPPLTGIPVFAPARTLGFSDIQQLKRLGWDEPFAPKAYIFYNAEQNRFVMSGEIPQAISDITKPKPGESAADTQKYAEARRVEQQEKMVAWGKLLMQLQLGVARPEESLEWDAIPGKSKEVEKDNQLRATSFDVVMRYTESPCVELHGDGYFASVGDATMTPDFHLAHGANHAMADGFHAAYCMPHAVWDHHIFKFSKDYFMTLRAQETAWVKQEMENIDRADRDQYVTLLEIYGDWMKEALLGPVSTVTQKGVAGITSESAPHFGEYLVKLGKPLEQYDPKLKPIREAFEKFMDEASLHENIDPDLVYQRITDYSNAINDAIDEAAKNKLKEGEKIQAKLKEEIKTARNELLKINTGQVGPMKSIIGFLKGRSQYWVERRAKLETHVKELEGKLKSEEAYQKKYQERMAELKPGTAKLMVKDSPVVFGFHRLQEMAKRPVAPAPEAAPIPAAIPVVAPATPTSTAERKLRIDIPADEDLSAEAKKPIPSSSKYTIEFPPATPVSPLNRIDSPSSSSVSRETSKRRSSKSKVALEAARAAEKLAALPPASADAPKMPGTPKAPREKGSLEVPELELPPSLKRHPEPSAPPEEEISPPPSPRRPAG